MEFPVTVVEGGRGTGNSVRISVQKLREVTSPHRAEESIDSVYIPPVLPVNKPRGDKLASDVAGGASSQAHVHDLFRTKSSSQQTQKVINYNQCKLPQWCSNSNHQHATAGHLPADGSRYEGNDILISQYIGGQKEAMKAIVKRKVQSGPIGKNVKVQLLRKRFVEDKESVAQDARETHYHLNSARTTAAATAAAIAATVPLLKAQSDLEAKIDTVAELVTKLQEMDQQMKQVAEQQAQAQDPGSKKHQERVRELETQLSTLLNQRLSHLEKLQEQQLELQSRMLTSAFTTSNINPVGAPPARSNTMSQSSATHHTATQTLNQGLQQLPSNNIHYVSLTDMPSDSSAAALAYRSRSVTGGFGIGSSLQTPAPRRFAPVPMSKDVQVQQKKNSAIQKAKVISADGQGNGDFLEKILNNQETPASETDTVEKTNVAMTTAGRHPERSSSGNPLTESFTAFVAPSRGSGSAASKASPAVQKATDVLHDLGRLKREMHGILQEAEHWQSRMQDIKSVSANQSKSNSHKPIDSPPLQHHLLKHPICTAKQTNPSHSQKPSLIQSVKAPKSMFEDAERILREVQTNKKFIEENLEAIVRAKDNASMYSVIDSMAPNSDAAEKIRIGKTVDAWITVISQDIQDEIAKKDFLQQMTSKQKEQELSLMRKGCDVKTIKFNKDVNDKTQSKPESTTKRSLSTARPPQKQLKESCGKKNLRSEAVTQTSQQKEQKSKISADLDGITLTDSVLQSEDYLKKVYGKAIYQGRRITYKKGPYLRVNSPVPKSKPQRPKMIESIKGVKVKSARTQTTPFLLKTNVNSPIRQRPLSAPHLQNNQYLFSPSRQITSSSLISGPVEGHLVPMAIPLGEPRIDGGVPQAAGLVISSARPITVTTSVPLSPPKPQPQVKKPNIAVVHMKSEKKDPVELTVQVLPNVDIDSLPSISPAASQRSPSPEQQQMMRHPTQTMIQSPEAVQSEEEDGTGFPGTSYIAIADLPKDPETDNELRGSPEPGIELEGFAESVSASYNGPTFPPSAPAPLPADDIADGMIKRKESIENHLIEWVEQELMSRIISEMCPLQQQLLPHVSQHEGEESVLSCSDIVEAAGGGGFQLFVDAGVPVDSQMVRQFVDEALAEIIAIMLGQRQSESRPPIQELPQQETPSPAVVIPTPAPTPRHTPSPPARGPSLIQTPDVTPQDSVAASEEKESESEPELEPLLKSSLVIDAVGLEPPGKTSPVGTPAITPTPTPSRVSTPSPVTEPISEKIKSTSSVPSQQFPNPWGDAELPLEEENPSSIHEAAPLPRAVVMSVAKDEEPKSLILPPCAVIPVLPTPLPCPPPHVRTPTPPAESLTPPPSTEESSSTISVTETETADRNISEGEILISYGQMAAAKALVEGGISLPNLNDSLSSTLHDALEMDEDPPSEGQVIVKPRKGLQKYSLGTMLAKVSQGPFVPQEIHHPENSDDDSSTGQISEGQMPRLTAMAEGILTGQSQYMNPFSMNRCTNIPQRRRSPSPGQFDIQTERNGRESDASYGPMTLGDLEICPVPALRTRQVKVAGQKTPTTEDRGQGDDISRTEQKPATARVIQVESRTKDPIQPSSYKEWSHG
ncbi:protein TALPID3 isoform X2 [Heptranchias perlo]|uniref:protein TALPID3 isoform X2 n=1 Tax=Heptranchias perlo TaxID=212740 RepID=UPI00355A53AE